MYRLYSCSLHGIADDGIACCGVNSPHYNSTARRFDNPFLICGGNEISKHEESTLEQATRRRRKISLNTSVCEKWLIMRGVSMRREGVQRPLLRFPADQGPTWTILTSFSIHSMHTSMAQTGSMFGLILRTSARSSLGYVQVCLYLASDMVF